MKSKAFTLIELLVVMSIISLLTSIILAFIGDARDKARDTTLLRNISELQKAIELYRLDKGYLPHQAPTVPINQNRYFDAKQRTSAGSVASSRSPSPSLNLANLLAGYYSGGLPDPHNYTNAYVGYRASGTGFFFKCSNQTEIPEYILVFSTHKDLNLPRAQQRSSTGSWPFSTAGGRDLYCISIL